MKLFPFGRKGKWGDFLLGIFLLLIIIPQTGKPIQIGLNRLKVLVWSPSVEKGETLESAEAFTYTVQNLSGERVALRIGEGKVTLLSLWATWCAPCVAELPSIASLYQDYKDQVNFVLVTHENTNEVKEFLSKKQLNLPVYFPTQTLPLSLQSNKVPTNFLIDGEGTILIKETGAADWNSTKVRDLLDGLLGE